MTPLIYTAADETATDALGAALAEVLPEGTTVALCGTLGAGKTRLVQAIAAAVGIDRRDVLSPTFVLIGEHHGRARSTTSTPIAWPARPSSRPSGWTSISIATGWCSLNGPTACPTVYRVTGSNPDRRHRPHRPPLRDHGRRSPRPFGAGRAAERASRIRGHTSSPSPFQIRLAPLAPIDLREQQTAPACAATTVGQFAQLVIRPSGSRRRRAGRRDRSSRPRRASSNA